METLELHIPQSLFSPAAYEHFEGEYALDVLKAGPDLYSFAQPLIYRVDVSNTGDALLLTGTVEGDATTSCARCLDSFSFPITGDVEGYFLINEGDEAPGDMEEEEFEVLPANNTIDLAPYLQAALLLEVPLVPLCKDDCAGICPTCGTNLNEGTCSCEPTEETSVANNPFAVLKDLPLDN